MLESLSVFEWAAIIFTVVGGLFTFCGIIAGSAWWMASLHALVKAAVKSLGVMEHKLDKHIDSNNGEHVELWREVNAHGRQLTELDTRLTNAEDRVACLEEQTEKQ